MRNRFFVVKSQKCFDQVWILLVFNLESVWTRKVFKTWNSLCLGPEYVQALLAWKRFIWYRAKAYKIKISCNIWLDICFIKRSVI